MPQHPGEGLTMRIAVVGGGPGGLFLAALVRQADPSAEVTVFERNRADDAFGFGVVFSDCTLAGDPRRRPRPAGRARRGRPALGGHRGTPQGRADPLRRQRHGRHLPPYAPRPAPGAGPRPGREPSLRDRGGPGRPRRLRPRGRRRRRVVADPRHLRRAARAVGGDGDRQVHLVRHGLHVRRAHLRPRTRPARCLRRARLPHQRGRQHVHRRDRRGDLAGHAAWTRST